MADKRNAPGAPEGVPRRQRTAPTIDLTATELASSPADNAPTAEPEPAEPQQPEPVQEPPSDPPPSPLPEQAPPPAIDEPPPAREAPPEMGFGAPPPDRAMPEPPPPPPSGGNHFNISALAAGLAGGLIVALALGALWYGGVLPPGAPPSTDAGAQIAALRKQVEDLQNRPSPPAPAIDTKTIDALNDRVGKIENTLANLPKGDTGAERLSAAENAMKSLGLALTALTKRSDDTAANAAQARVQAEAAEKAVGDLRGSVQSAEKTAATAVAPADLDALQQRIAGLEQAAKVAREDIGKIAAAGKAARLALSAQALRSAVASGAPYAAELAQAQSLGGGDKVLAPLAPLASTGLPSATALAQELRALMPAMRKASGAQAAQTGGFLERLEANASRLVRVTPVDAPRGDDASAVLTRIDIAAAHADIAAALADLAKLPDTARAPAQDWIEKAKARQAALATARDFAAASAHALSQP